jgi:hypothetical protein
MENEIWKPIIGFEGIYEVSSLGRVKSFRNPKERILRPTKNGRGYMKVILYKSDTKKQITVHQLVSIAFLNHVPNGNKLVIDHINDNKTDNRLDNLQVVTQSFNLKKRNKKQITC